MIDAPTQKDAETLAEKEALRKCDPDSWQADLDDTDIINLHIEMIEGSDIDPPYRCDKTPDMFEVNNANNH